MRLTHLILGLAPFVATPCALAQEVGQPAPEIALEQAFQGPASAEITLAKLRGKVIVLEYWATW